MIKSIHKDLLDEEWVEIMKEAKDLGLTIEDVEKFLLEVKN